MYIYLATNIVNDIKIKRLEVIGETDKQYKTRDVRVNKSLIGSYNSNGYGYGLTPEQAVQGVYNYINKNIEKAKSDLEYWSKRLNCPITYEYSQEKEE